MNQTSVFEFFKEQLGATPKDETLKELPMDSGCGHDCVRAIVLARAYKDMADPHPHVVRPLIQSVEATLSVFWHG